MTEQAQQRTARQQREESPETLTTSKDVLIPYLSLLGGSKCSDPAIYDELKQFFGYACYGVDTIQEAFNPKELTIIIRGLAAALNRSANHRNYDLRKGLLSLVTRIINDTNVIQSWERLARSRLNEFDGVGLSTIVWAYNVFKERLGIEAPKALVQEWREAAGVKVKSGDITKNAVGVITTEGQNLGWLKSNASPNSSSPQKNSNLTEGQLVSRSKTSESVPATPARTPSWKKREWVTFFHDLNNNDYNGKQKAEKIEMRFSSACKAFSDLSPQLDPQDLCIFLRGLVYAKRIASKASDISLIDMVNTSIEANHLVYNWQTAAFQFISVFDAGNLSAAVWAMANLKTKPTDDFFRIWAYWAEDKIKDFEPRHLVMTITSLVSFANLELAPPATLLEKIVKQVEDKEKDKEKDKDKDKEKDKNKEQVFKPAELLRCSDGLGSLGAELPESIITAAQRAQRTLDSQRRRGSR